MYADGTPGGSWTHVEEVFDKQFKDPFWERPGWYSNIFQSILIEENR
jgi:hypothetical protein